MPIFKSDKSGLENNKSLKKIKKTQIIILFELSLEF